MSKLQSLAATCLLIIASQAQLIPVFSDDFERNESQELKDEPGNGWTTSSDKTAGGHKQVDLRDGAIHISTHETANHAASLRHEFAFKDGTIELRFRLDDPQDSLKINIADPTEKTVHAGHLYHVIVSPSQLQIVDLKTGVMDLKLRKWKQKAPDNKKLRAILVEKQKSFPLKLATATWHTLTFQNIGDTISVSINGTPAGSFTSPGFAHPTKKLLRFLAAKNASIDDLKIFAIPVPAPSGIKSIETGHTISRVRTTADQIIASTYEGSILVYKKDGTFLWKNELSGYMNRDLICSNLGDDQPDILAANADGHLYCLSAKGELLWKFRANDAPMNAVCVLQHDGHPLIVCGGYDSSIYYLSATGKLLGSLHSSAYSKEKSWGKPPLIVPPKYVHVANFLRPVRLADGDQAIAIHAALNANSGRGSVYLLKPFAEKALKHIKVPTGGSTGDLQVHDLDGDGADELILGASSIGQDAAVTLIDLTKDKVSVFEPAKLRRQIDGFGYRVSQSDWIKDGDQEKLLTLHGNAILLNDLSLDPKTTEVLNSSYSFNDMWLDRATNTLVLASAQSGGSCLHLLDLSDPTWKKAYEKLTPPGNITAILSESAKVREQLKSFTKPAHERDLSTVYLTNDEPSDVPALAVELRSYDNLVFLNYDFFSSAEDFDRSIIKNDFYRDRRDRRKKYTATREEILKRYIDLYEDHPGIAYWGGHGNDPYMVSLEAQKQIVAAEPGKKTVMIYPELEKHSDDFAYVLDNHIYPLAEFSRDKNGMIFVRTKHTFWQSIIYMPLWSRLVSGEFADVFIPSMEETTDKSMELSLAARTGIWASGSVNQWGTRGARDNASFDRLREHSHQMLPNHFLRTLIYHTSHGATYLNNFSVDQEYMSLLWQLIGKGVLYVPKRNEIVSYSPVHLSMIEPDEHFLDEGNNAKWITFYDEKKEANNPLVFGRLNGTWPGAPNTAWDFSRYAAGVKERRLNFLAPYQNGLVLITPPQQGKFSDSSAPRGQLSDNLHPLYKDILKEHITDGRNYLSPDGTQTFGPKEHSKTIESEIKESAKLLPLTVSGNVAWVTAQSGPKNLRLTLIDSGYINPGAKTATITFHTTTPVKITDLLSGEELNIANPKNITAEIPAGLFRFLDITLESALISE